MLHNRDWPTMTQLVVSTDAKVAAVRDPLTVRAHGSGNGSTETVICHHH